MRNFECYNEFRRKWYRRLDILIGYVIVKV